MPNTVFTQWEKHISTQITLKQSLSQGSQTQMLKGLRGQQKLGRLMGEG